MANMEYIVYSQMAHKNQQVLTTFDWEFNIDFSSYVGYHPPMELIKTATTAISGDVDNPLPQQQPITVPLRGFTIQQPGLSDPSSMPSPITFQMQDFEDQSLFAWAYDWLNRCNSVQNRASYRRESIFVDVDIWRLNSTRVRVLQMHYFNCMITGANYTNGFNDQKAAVGQMSLVLQPEWKLVTALNI